MSTTTRVFELDDHRGRREDRLRKTLALLAADPRRARLASQLADLMSRIGGDRAMLAWVDEFDADQARAHLVVDLIRDVPRRNVDLAPITEAWDRGVPGVLDLPQVRLADRSTQGSLAVVSLGSDGRRAWFAVIEGSYRRAPLGAEQIDMLTFRTGALAGTLLHPEVGIAFDGWRSFGFDPEQPDGEIPERILVRLMVMRFLRALVADDFVMHAEELEERVDLLGDELRGWGDDLEGALWRRIVDAGGAGNLDALGRACLDLGERLAHTGELESAIEAYGVAYEVASVQGDADRGGFVARRLGRAHRNAGAWTESEQWYRTSQELARVLGDAGAEAITLDGLASTQRVKGALPAARRTLARALELAKVSRSGYALGSVHQGLFTLSAIAGERERAVQHGWSAVEEYETAQDQLRALVSVAGLLLESGQGELAERTYQVILRHVEEPYYRLFALDGFAHSAALRGHRAEYLARCERLEAEDWRAAGPDFEGQVYLYRGRAWEAFGEFDRAREWFARALDFAETHRLTATLFSAEEGLERIESAGSAAAAPQPAESDVGSTEFILDRIERADRRLAGVGG
ncbi:tetratricopeptide repeat protein [Gemmatimonadota bacterium Y43]|uniref:tetratricopeptide repeat protein n=1 Tax=Gaopeijia maritima TaxID=3119007 RepID=UPI0032704841